MTGISTGVNLLPVSQSLTLKDGLLGYWDFEGTLNSYTGINAYAFNGTIDSGTNDPSKDISYSTGAPKVGSYKGSTLAYNSQTPNGYYASIRPGLTLNKTKGSFVGWVRVVGSTGTSYGCVFPGLSTISSTGLDMGVSISSSTAINDTAASVQFISGSSLTTINPTQWIFICYWYDFTDTSQGANGSQYFQINNGTIYSRQTPAVGAIFTYLTRAPGFGYNPGSGGTYVNGADVDAVGIYDRVLTSTERSNLYNSGNGLSYSQLY